MRVDSATWTGRRPVRWGFRPTRIGDILNRMTCDHHAASAFKRDLRAAAERIGVRPGYPCMGCGAWVWL